MSADDPRLAMLAALQEPAFRMGLICAEIAESAGQDLDRFVRFVELFNRCSAAVRLSIALELRLQREARLAARPAQGAVQEDAERPEGLDVGLDEPLEDDLDGERPERLDVGAERERDREVASFPRLARLLDGIVADIAALPPPAPPELPSLGELLARYSGPVAEADARPAAAPLRARLAGSSAVVTLRRPPGRATGPP